ncbi:MAG TPA: glycoside hydrolase family 3 N-terminal domain-containing protein [Gemmatimonadota bacterium]|nr:glycoside hydrolase family 3 N-terminal domain-containing protein [Gemmatimonadota bacterium]
MPPSPARAQEVAIDSLLGLMTLEEKLGQLAQYSARWNPDLDVPEATPEHLEMVREGRVGSFLSLYGAGLTEELQRIAVEESRLGIPLLFAHDVIHGFRTIFPIPLAEAATWDPETVERAARVAAVEATGAGVHWTFAPMVDIARDPRWGRIVEGSGEDPYLGSVLARARVRGFQGLDPADPTTLLATAKHYVAYGGAEGGRDYNTVDVSERTLHEIYLPPFRAAVDEGVVSVMAAFNEIGGVPMHAHEGLIDGLLRERWGWEGVLVSDYTGVLELIQHGVAADSLGAGILALEAGVDVDMMSGIYGEKLAEAVRSGRLEEAEVDEAVRRVLLAKARLGLFEDPYRYADPARERAVTLTDEHRRAARETARRAIVLLQNDGTLPFRKDGGTVAVIGPLADDRDAPLGPWAGAGRAEDVVTVLAGIREAVGQDAVRFARGAGIEEKDTTGFAEAVRLAGAADAVVLVLGESRQISGEAASRHTLDLPGVQLELAERVLAADRPTAVVLMNGRPLAIPWLAENAPAILETWFLGTETGPAVADVLFGDVSPGGRLPVSFPRAVGQVPIYYNRKNTGRPPGEEKYTSKYLELPSTPLYPFGHGLSYTTFEYGEPTLSSPTMSAVDTLTVSVDVTNTGDRTGDEVVQMYVRDLVRSATPPVMELKGFERVTLAPGETLTVAFPIAIEDLAFYDADGWWVVEPGTFAVMVGGSSAETREARFEASEGTRLRYTPAGLRMATERESDR